MLVILIMFYTVELKKNNLFGNNGLDMFIAGDQIKRGAALNAVLIAEEIIGTRK